MTNAKPSMVPCMVPCGQHGPSAWCYVMPDGSHVDSENCRCFRRTSRDCPAHGRR